MFDDPGQGAEMRDAKTRLAGMGAGTRPCAAPVYTRNARSGPAHAPHFVIEAMVEGMTPETGEGGSKREAEQDAAAKLLAQAAP